MANSKKQTTSEGNAGEQSKTGLSGGGSIRDTSLGAPQQTSRPSTGMTTTSSTGGGAGAGTAAARSLYDQAKETAGQAYEVAAEKATTKLEEQKSTLSGGLASVAGSVRQVSDNLTGPDIQDGISKFTAEYSQLAARKIENVANYLERKSVREMYTDVESFARRNPAVFVGGAFVLGLIAARFLKSGTSTPSDHSRYAFDNWQDRQPSIDTGVQPNISPVSTRG